MGIADIQAIKCVADIEGPWFDPPDRSMTGLIERCKQHWAVPVNQLSDEMVATYLRQKIATALMVDEASRRLAAGIADGSELYEGELAEALNGARH